MTGVKQVHHMTSAAVMWPTGFQSLGVAIQEIEHHEPAEVDWVPQ